MIAPMKLESATGVTQLKTKSNAVKIWDLIKNDLKNRENTIHYEAHNFKITGHELLSVSPQNSEFIVDDIDNVSALDSRSFQNQPRPGTSSIPTTIPNVKHLLASYNITVNYNVISKRTNIRIPGVTSTIDNADAIAMSHIISLAILNGMSTAQVPEFVSTLTDRNQINPVTDWINSKPWDKVDRLDAICNTITTRDDFPLTLKRTLVHRWLISTVAAVMMPSGFRCRGVLTLQGPQSIGKTSWVGALISDPLLREQVLKIDHHMDASDKDSLLTALSHWIVEIGELDGSLKKDIARLKGFLTNDKDKIRKPYGRTDSVFPRKTVFYASVNESHFLVDKTGNTRWWTIPVTHLNYQHNIDTQQLFAQIAEDYAKGEKWWLTQDEETSLEKFNSNHRSLSAIHERIVEIIDTDKVNATNLPAMSATEVLKTAGVLYPNNGQCKEANAILRELLGESKRIQGVNKWRVPLKQTGYNNTALGEDDDY